MLLSRKHMRYFAYISTGILILSIIFFGSFGSISIKEPTGFNIIYTVIYAVFGGMTYVLGRRRRYFKLSELFAYITVMALFIGIMTMGNSVIAPIVALLGATGIGYLFATYLDKTYYRKYEAEVKAELTVEIHKMLCYEGLPDEQQKKVDKHLASLSLKDMTTFAQLCAQLHRRNPEKHLYDSLY